jgi:AcrR family transcriptional regulator
MATRNAKARPRSAGRPRIAPGGVARDVREEVLAAAAGLFEARGYTATSTRDIADEVGVRQASLFHYFARKQDILTELLDQTVRPTLDFVHRTALLDREADVALWLLVRTDVVNLCRGPHNLGSLQLLPEARHTDFDWFWRRRQKLFKIYLGLVAGSIASGPLHRSDPRMMNNLVFGLVESVIIAPAAFRRMPTTPLLMADSALRVCGVPLARLRRARAALDGLEDR